MISIIICSKKSGLSPELISNIQENTRLPYELIVIDNSEHQYTIFTAYNEGIRRSKFDYLCFMHDDVLLYTSDWAERVVAHLADPKIGLIGVCGSLTYSPIPAPWGLYENLKFIIQYDRRYKNSKFINNWGTIEASSHDAVALDGVFMCARKSLFEHIRFDDIQFKGFHLYDIDISLQTRKAGFGVLVVNDILLKHYSKGIFNRDWVLSSMLLIEKWEHSLPVTVSHISPGELDRKEFRYMTRIFVKHLIRAGFNNSDCLLIVTRHLKHHPCPKDKRFVRVLKGIVFRTRLLKHPLSFFMQGKVSTLGLMNGYYRSQKD